MNYEELKVLDTVWGLYIEERELEKILDESEFRDLPLTTVWVNDYQRKGIAAWAVIERLAENGWEFKCAYWVGDAIEGYEKMCFIKTDKKD